MEALDVKQVAATIRADVTAYIDGTGPDKETQHLELGRKVGLNEDVITTAWVDARKRKAVFISPPTQPDVESKEAELSRLADEMTPPSAKPEKPLVTALRAHTDWFEFCRSAWDAKGNLTAEELAELVAEWSDGPETWADFVADQASPTPTSKAEPEPEADASPFIFHPSDLAVDKPPPATLEDRQRWLEELADLHSSDPLAYVEKRKQYAKRLSTTNDALDKAVKLVRDSRLEEKALLEEKARLDEKAKAEVEAKKKNHRSVRPDYDAGAKQCVDPKSFMELAEHFLASAYIDEESGYRTLHWYDKQFYVWDGSRYIVKGNDSLRADIYLFLPKLWIKPQGAKTKDTLEKIQASTDLVHQVTEALKARINVEIEAVPAWIGGDYPYGNIKEALSCRNGILHVPTRTLHPHSPLFFTYNAVGYLYDVESPKPKKWLKYLDDLFPRDTQTINCIQEIFGLCLTEETKYQKGFIVKGPTRSGKGTIFSKILTEIIGRGSFVGKSLNQMATEYGRANLVGKKVMVAPDARMERNRKVAITENLLSIIGEDPLSHNRKYLGEWEGILTTKIIICTNELPSFNDPTGVIAGRFIILIMTKSFYGMEDLNLAEKLLEEKASILDWAIEGYLRLRNRGHFVQPETGKECMRDLRINSSQILSFTNDRCEFGEHTTEGEQLYNAYTSWCRKNGVFYILDRNHFGRQLLDACPQVVTTRPREGGPTRPIAYVGIKIREAETESLWDYKAGKPVGK